MQDKIISLLEELTGSDVDTRWRVAHALTALGLDVVVPVLRRIRAEGPGRLRRGVLWALAEIAGESGLDERDRAAVERLIRIKLRTEQPEPTVPCGLWLAVRGGDQAALLEALDLSDARPATLRMGFDAFHNDGRYDDLCYSRVFLTPELDGWTLVLGFWWPGFAAREGDPVQGMVEACARLSERFGAVHQYTHDVHTGESTWLICEAGTVVRFCDVDDPDLEIGSPLPVEQREDGFCDALTVAEAMSVNLATLGPHTTVRGHGLLALTPYGRVHGVPPGALRI